MQSIADQMGDEFPSPSSSAAAAPEPDLASLSTFVLYSQRRKVTSSAKKRRKPGERRLAQTPEGSYLDYVRNWAEVLRMGRVAAPEARSAPCPAPRPAPRHSTPRPALLWRRVRHRRGSVGAHASLPARPTHRCAEWTGTSPGVGLTCCCGCTRRSGRFGTSQRRRRAHEPAPRRPRRAAPRRTALRRAPYNQPHPLPPTAGRARPLQVRGGSVAEGSELELEIAEADVDNLRLDGSLRVRPAPPRPGRPPARSDRPPPPALSAFYALSAFSASLLSSAPALLRLRAGDDVSPQRFDCVALSVCRARPPPPPQVVAASPLGPLEPTRPGGGERELLLRYDDARCGRVRLRNVTARGPLAAPGEPPAHLSSCPPSSPRSPRRPCSLRTGAASRPPAAAPEP